MSEPNSVV